MRIPMGDSSPLGRKHFHVLPKLLLGWSFKYAFKVYKKNFDSPYTRSRCYSYANGTNWSYVKFVTDFSLYDFIKVTRFILKERTKITKFEVNIFWYVSHAMEDLLFLPQEHLSLTRIHLFLSSANKIKLESITYVQVTHVASKFCEIESTDQTEIRLFSE